MGKKITDDMSDQELSEVTTGIMTKLEDEFASLSPSDLMTVAQRLDETSSTIKMEDVLTGNGYVDPYKLAQEFINEQRLGNADQITEDGVSASGKELTDAASEHEEALKNLTDVIVNETVYLQQAVEDVKNGSRNSYTNPT